MQAQCASILCLPLLSPSTQPPQVRIVKHAFEIIALLTDQNPVQTLVDAIINR